MSDNTSDIMERLRACASGELCPSVAEEGAAAIARLEYENRALKAGQALQLTSLRDQRLIELQAEIERLKECLAICEQENAELRARR